MTHFALYYVAKQLFPIAISQLWAHMTPEQIHLAVQVMLDGETAAEVARLNGVSRSTVARALIALRKTLTRLNVSLPDHARAWCPDTRHVRQIPDAVARNL